MEATEAHAIEFYQGRKGPFYFTGKNGRKLSYSTLPGAAHRFPRREDAEIMAAWLRSMGLRLQASVISAAGLPQRAPYERGI